MEREQRSNKNLRTTRPAQNFAGTKKFDVDRLHPTPPNMVPAQEPEPVEMATAVVAKGRTVHVPTGKRVWIRNAVLKVDQRTGEIVGEDRQIFQGECIIAKPGEVVTLPIDEIERLRGLGFLEGPTMFDPRGKPLSKAERDALIARTGIKDDPRVAAAVKPRPQRVPIQTRMSP